MRITKICTHHTGPLSPTDPYSSSRNITEAQINNAHKARDFNLSQMNYYVGYNLVIYPDGTKKQYRLLGEQTAAATGSNFDTFHICLVGNFTAGVDVPKKEQIDTLKLVIRALIENKPESAQILVVPGVSFVFTAYNVFPHRILQPKHTLCHGDSLDDNFGRSIAFEYLKEKNSSNVTLYRVFAFLSDFFKTKKLGTILVGSKTDGVEYCNFIY